MGRGSNVVVIAFESKDVQRLIELLLNQGIAYEELRGFFDVEAFKTLNEVEIWWKDLGEEKK
jgi:hypothetical protein